MSDITHYDGCWSDPKHHACAVREIERLRDEGQKDYDGMREFQRKFIDASHEIERLRAERDAYSNEITGTLMPELERLRGLLREAIEDGYVRIPYGASHEDVSAIRDFERRIKEAL